MNLLEQFRRQFRITGSQSTVAQDNRIIERYFIYYLETNTICKSFERLSQDELNGFYHFILNQVKGGKISKNYGKDIFYAVNKLINRINRKYRKSLNKYNVAKFIDSFR
ncbi:hypothetical protein DSN97_05910 [Deferribacteraceae bacterium V6Fe1]|nr:hypothetical protein DSN97_05910 [Deferribacteraceae bacterium V6Fe1]